MENILIFHVISMSLYEFKSSLRSPCNQSIQRRRKVYCCWVLSAGLRYWRLTRPPRHDRSPVPGGNRSAASSLIHGSETGIIPLRDEIALLMDARTCHFHRTVGYAANGCRKIRIASRMIIMMRIGRSLLRETTRHVTRVHLGEAWNWTCRAFFPSNAS